MIAVVAIATTVASFGTAVVVVADALVSVTVALESRMIPLLSHVSERDPSRLGFRTQTSKLPLPNDEVVAATTNPPSVVC